MANQSLITKIELAAYLELILIKVLDDDYGINYEAYNKIVAALYEIFNNKLPPEIKSVLGLIKIQDNRVYLPKETKQ